MKKYGVKHGLSIILLAILLANLTVSVEMPVVSGENPYETSRFVNIGYLVNMPYLHPHNHHELIGHAGAGMIENRTIQGIWIHNISGTGEKKVLYANVSISFNFSPKFSPDGKMIVFCRIGKWGIYLDILEKNGTRWDENATLRTIYQRPKYGIRDPSFSPDGKRIIFHSNEIGYNGDVWVIDIDGANRTRLTFDDRGGRYPSFSADGTKIVYARWGSRGEHELWIMNSDGSNQRRLLDDSWYPSQPVFMPDGRILFESARISPHSRKVGPPSIWMMNMDGSNRILLAPNRISSVGSMGPTINRNGTRIAFEHGYSSHQTIYIVDCPDGGLWKDSDGDGVADICDGYPFDPTRGYYIDDEKIPGFTTGAMVSSVLIAVPAIRRRMQVRGDRHPSPPADRGHLGTRYDEPELWSRSGSNGSRFF